MPCRVELLTFTREAERTVAAAAKLCYSAVSASDIMRGVSEDNAAAFLAKLLASGHMSPFEHASYTFAIDGLSRVSSHQLVRHRLASYSQQSQRYVAMKDSGPVLPPSIEGNSEALAIWQQGVESARDSYERLCALGIPREDARFILPHGWETNIIMTMNARELRHFFSLRLCRRAQWEIRALALAMWGIVTAESPSLFIGAGPGCVAGSCTESHPCGRPYGGSDEMMQELKDLKESGILA